MAEVIQISSSSSSDEMEKDLLVEGDEEGDSEFDDEDDDDEDEEWNEKKKTVMKKGKTFRGPNITMEEDVALCKAYVSASRRDAMAGSQQQQQQASTLWGRVFQVYPNVNNRLAKSLYHRFYKIISKDVKKFVRQLALVESKRQRGCTDVDMMQQARSMFQAANRNKAFRFEDCYNVLKVLPKFSSSSTDGYRKRKKKGQENDQICSPSTSVAAQKSSLSDSVQNSNLSDSVQKSNPSDSVINSEVSLERNPEREVLKERLKKKLNRSDEVSAIVNQVQPASAFKLRKKGIGIEKRLLEFEREEHEQKKKSMEIDKQLLQLKLQNLELKMQKQELKMQKQELKRQKQKLLGANR